MSATVTDNATVNQGGGQIEATAEEYQAAIDHLVLRLQTADAIITALVLKAGGEVTLNKDDVGLSTGYMVQSQPSEDNSTITLKAHAVQPAVDTVQ